ncbi:hypothetical protein L0337_03880 [candidate division KSB1 bacterium]|nr:hypothetical protein [candidate division KSB1 bacterium]
MKSKSLAFWLFITTISGVIALLLLCTQNVCRLITFSDSTGLYFYSALVQANAAILSIVGVFTIFKIQSIQSSIDLVKNILVAEGGRRITIDNLVEFDQMSLENKKSAIQNGKYSKAILPLFNNWATQIEKINKIKLSIKLPTRLLVVGIVGDSIGVLAANLVHENGVRIESCVLCLFLLLEIYIVIFVVDGIFKAVGD